MATDDDMKRCLRAFAAGEEGDDADRGRDAIKKLGGKGLPQEAKDLLESFGEPVVDPAEEQRDAIKARMGGVTSAMARGIHWQGNSLVFPITLTREQAEERLLRRARKGDGDASRVLARMRGRR